MGRVDQNFDDPIFVFKRRNYDNLGRILTHAVVMHGQATK